MLKYAGECRLGPLDGQVLTSDKRRHAMDDEDGFYLLTSDNKTYVWFSDDKFEDVSAALIDMLQEDRPTETAVLVAVGAMKKC